MTKTMIHGAALALLLGWGASAQANETGLLSGESRFAELALDPSQVRTPKTGNNSAPPNWRVTPNMTFNGVNFDGVARIEYTALDGFGYVCSGTLLAGGTHVLTAAHCADGFTDMKVSLGVYNDVAKATRGVAAAYVHAKWTGNNLGMGADIAVLKLDAPVIGIQGFKLSTTNDLGKTFLMMGHGTTGTGPSGEEPNWKDWGYAHWGMNVADVTSNNFNATIFGDEPSTFGEEYIADYDGLFDQDKHNTLQRFAGAFGGDWTSDTGLGKNEALIAGGDSGGGDFVWTGSEWVVSGVHSWGWQICAVCDVSRDNDSSWGDISGSTAVFSHVDWINSVTAVPEPASAALLLGGLAAIGGLSRRRKSQA